MGEGRAPLPIVPPPFPDERLSSWLERIADVYLVSREGLQRHVGWVRPALQLEREPVQNDLKRIAAATSSSVQRLLAMTFHDAPARYRDLLLLDSQAFCPGCSRGMQRPQRLRSWAFAFSFWCERHRQPLVSCNTRGASALGDYWIARQGAQILHRWAMGGDSDTLSVSAILSLLLSPVREASPAAPWELAGLPFSCQHEPSIRSQRFRRPALTVVVPEYRVAVPIYEQQLPSAISDLPDTSGAERYALAIGVARVLQDPADAIVRILEASDEFGRKKVTALIDRWPTAIRSAVDRRAPCTRRRGEGARAATSPRVNRSRVRAPSARDPGRDQADA